MLISPNATKLRNVLQDDELDANSPVIPQIEKPVLWRGIRSEDLDPHAKINTNDVTSQRGKIEDDRLNEIHEVPEEDKPPMGLKDTLSYLKENGFYEFKRGNKLAEMSEERLADATAKHGANSDAARKMVRVGAYAQGIQAVADLFTMHQKKNSPSSVGARHGVKLSEEGMRRIEAENIIYEKEIEAHFERMFRDAARDEELEHMNTQLANQVNRENLAQQVRALNETIGAYQDGTIDPDRLSVQRGSVLVERLISGGQFEAAIQLGKELGVFDENLNIDFRRFLNASSPTQEQLPPEQIKANEVAEVRFDMLQNEIAQQEAVVAQKRAQNQQLGREIGNDDPDVKRLEELQNQANEIAKNPHVQNRQVEREHARLISAPRARQAIEAAPFDTDEFYVAVENYIGELQRAGYTQQEAEQKAVEAIRSNPGPRIQQTINKFTQFYRDSPDDAEILRAEMIKELIAFGIPEDNATQVANQVIKSQNTPNKETPKNNSTFGATGNW